MLDPTLITLVVPTDTTEVTEPTSATSLPVKVIDRKHPEFTLLNSTWHDLSLLYAGGWALDQEKSRFLRRRPKELQDVYTARLEQFTYQNHLGTALDWYSSELFEEDPHIQAVEYDANGDLKNKDLPVDQKAFWDAFLVNCNNAGTSYSDFCRGVFSGVLLMQKSYVLMDMPRVEGARTLADQKVLGQVDAKGKPKVYICRYTPEEVINWEEDQFGNLNWIVIKTKYSSGTLTGGSRTVDRWSFYNRQDYQIWERERDPNEVSTPDKAQVTLVAQGQHLMAKHNKVPVKVHCVPDGLWLANRAMLPAKSHLNTDNVLDWALFMAALAMPVVMADEEINPTLMEAGFIKLPSNAKYQWSEPVGTSFAHLGDRLQELTENIFRSFYLIHQGRSGRSTPAAQSGVSKQMDMMPSKDILKMFGDLLRAFMADLLEMVSLARNEDLHWDIRGFEFKDDISLEEAQTLQTVLGLNVPSDLLEKAVYKRLARAVVPSETPNSMRAIFKQLDEAPDKLTRDLATMKKTADARATAMNSEGMGQAAQNMQSVDKFNKVAGSDGSGAPGGPQSDN